MLTTLIVLGLVPLAEVLHHHRPIPGSTHVPTA
jgi:hypothetical protein